MKPSWMLRKFGLVRIPRPQNCAEFAILTKWFYGKALSVARLFYYGSNVTYEVAEAYDSYHGPGFRFPRGGPREYEDGHAIMEFCFGPLRCGGTGRASYGQSQTTGHRHRHRLGKWMTDVELIGRGLKGSPPRKPFLRLADRITAVGENEPKPD